MMFTFSKKHRVVATGLALGTVLVFCPDGQTTAEASFLNKSYASEAESGAEALDWIENRDRNIRKNMETKEQQRLRKDIADMKTPEMMEIAAAHNCHPAVICLKWAVQRGQIPIPFSVFEMEYESNINSTCDGDPLTDEEMAKIATLEKNNRLVKGQVFLWEGANDWHDLWDEDGVIVDCPDAK